MQPNTTAYMHDNFKLYCIVLLLTDCSLHNDITASGPCDTDPGCKIDDTCKSKGTSTL